MTKSKLSLLLVLLILIGSISYYFYTKTPPTTSSLGGDPQNATYIINAQNIKLIDGKSEEVIPDSASKVITQIFGQPVLGDLNGDGAKDAVSFLTQSTGGSGDFYYAVVALNINGMFEGLEAVLLGDRIAPQNIQIKDGIAIVNFAERKAGEPMTARPSMGVSKYIVVENGGVKDVSVTAKGDLVFSGGLVMGEGARSFTPCGGAARWVIGSSTAYKKLMSAYENRVMGVNPYEPLFVTISGKIVDAPKDGFGADYDYGIEVSELIKVTPSGKCGVN